MMTRKRLAWLAVMTILVLILAACGGGSGQSAPETGSSSSETGAAEVVHMEGDDHSAEEHAVEEVHTEGDEHAADLHEEGSVDEGDTHGHTLEEHKAGAHAVPEEALALENPIPPTEDSIARGAEIYAQNCAACHGPEGYGDGPAAAALDPKPANLHADHVQDLPDGGLFWIISHGAPGTAMPAWKETLSEEDRWHVVNFIRTFREE